MESKYTFIKKNLLIFAILLVLTALSFCLPSYLNRITPPAQENYENAVSAINSKLPIMLDKETRFDSVMLRNKTLYFQYTLVNKKATMVDVEKLRTRLRREVYKTYCAENDTMRLFRNNGYSARYSYLDKNMHEVLTTIMIPQDCF